MTYETQAHDISKPETLDTLRAWEPVAKPTWYRDQDGNLRNTENVGKVVFRNDTGEAIGQIGAKADIVSNEAKLELFEQLQMRGVLRNLECGQWRNGARVWLRGQSEASSFELKKGHEIKHKLMLIDGYDGSVSLMLADTPLNLACNNMFASLRKQASTQKIRHTANVSDRFGALVKQISKSVTEFAKTREALETLAAKRATFDVLKGALDEFFPLLPVEGDDAEKIARKNERTQDVRNRICKHHEEAPGADPGTRYGVYQALTYWLTHERGRDGSRFEQNVTGEGARLNRRFLAHLLN